MKNQYKEIILTALLNRYERSGKSRGRDTGRRIQLREKDEIISTLKSLTKKYTIEKIAKEYDCSKQTIYRAIQNGIVEAEALSGQEYSRNSRKYIPATELPKLFRKIKIGD